MKRVTLFITMVLLLAFGAEITSAQSGYDLYQKALVKERAVGNVEEAIRLYQQIVKEFSSNHALAAKAQLRLGLLYERLGRKAEAQRAFQAVVSQYADQAEIARQAQAKLPKGANAAATMHSKAATGLTVRQVPVGPDLGSVDRVSPDGRYLIGEDRETKDLIIRDLMTGEQRHLTNKTAKDENVEESIFSPDGKQIATIWGVNQEKFHELRIRGIDGSGSRVLYRSDKPGWIWPWDWSPDGKHILVHINEGTNNSLKDSMALISVADGSTRILKSVSFEKRPGGISGMHFSPDGRYIAYGYWKDSSQYDISVISSDGSRDVPLVQSPADDRPLGWMPDGKSILFSSDRSKTIDIWMIPVADGKPQGSPELVKRGLGRVQSLGFTRSGSFYYSPNEEARDIYIATLAPETGKLSSSPVLAKTRFTGSNTKPDWSPDGRYLVYNSFSASAEDPAGVIQTFILNPETGEEREVRSKLKRFNDPLWFPDGKSLLVRDWGGAADYRGAGLFKIDSETGDATLIAPEKLGSELHTPLLARDGKAVFYQNKNILWKRNLETGEDKEIYRPTPPTEGPRFTDSLAVSPDGQRIAFVLKQSLLLVPTTGGDARELLRLREPETFGGYGFDVAWTPDGRYLLFVKRNDMQSELWRIPVAGGEAQKLGQVMGRVSGLRVHPDGQHIAFNLWHSKKTEVWVMENFLPTAQPRKASVTKR
jgi:Tol biopolymer transport system component